MIMKILTNTIKKYLQRTLTKLSLMNISKNTNPSNIKVNNPNE